MEKRKKNKNFLKKIIVILLLVIILDLIYFFVMFEEKYENNNKKIVTKIIDGDTIIVQGGEKVRLSGMDCSERGERCYKEAIERIKQLIFEKEVLLESDFEDKDRYGRSLRYVFLDGENINSKMVSEGICVARFESESKYQNEIKRAEEKAMKGKIGCKWN